MVNLADDGKTAFICPYQRKPHRVASLLVTFEAACWKKSLEKPLQGFKITLRAIHSVMERCLSAVNEGTASFMEYKCINASFPEMAGQALFQRATTPDGMPHCQTSVM